MSLRKTVAVSRETEVHELARQVSQHVFVADTIAEASDIIAAHDPDLILFDHRFNPHVSQFLAATDNISNAPVVIVGTDETDSDTIAAFEEMGAYDYLRGKQDHHRIKEIANRITSRSETDSASKTASRFFAEDFAEPVSMVGQSQAIKYTLKMVKLVATSRCNPILIIGETGTGKELVAKAIHLIRHPDEPFVAVNCAALTANLLESELFGHAKGAFTGADREKTGLLEIAGAGTLFLDEISEMPTDLQAKLLRVLQENNFRKVGGTTDIQSRATIIASSNRNLLQDTRTNRFRQDLYYRLNISPIAIAPLRSPQRRQDIQLLAEYFVKTSTICPQKQNKITSLTKLALEALQKFDWPGNVRELQNLIERAILHETTDKIGLSSIIFDPTELSEFSDGPTTGKIEDLSLAKAESELIARALAKTGWQKSEAAKRLRISRATLYAKIKQYNIEKAPSPAEQTAPQIPSPEPVIAVG